MTSTREDQGGGDDHGGLRVEELARRADVSVDTIRFYQKRRLLPPPRRDGRIVWYGPAHLERLARIKDLQRRGFSLVVIRRLLEGELDPADEPLAAAVATAEGAREELITADELASRAGVPRELLDAVVDEGLLLPRVMDGGVVEGGVVEGDDARFTTADVDVVAAGLRLVEAGLPMPELLALARRHHATTRVTAEEAVALFDAHVRQPLLHADLDDDARAEQLVEAFRVLLPAVSALVAHHFQRVLLQVAQEHLASVGDPAELAAAEAEARRGVEAAQ
jgi:DNA-binding transcriptional MerR regulator